MRPLHEVVKDGFRLTDMDRRLTSLALASLRISLKAYFSTYKALHRQLHVAEPAMDEEDRKQKDFNVFADYWDTSSEAILHFQHFTELVLKEILRKEHELLVLEPKEQHVLLHKLLKQEAVDAAEEAGANTIDARIAIERICELHSAGRLDPAYGHIVAAKAFLIQLTKLRNRIWHGGTYVLRYQALDDFIGGYGLALLAAILALPDYTGLEARWKYKPLSVPIDPIEEIAKECSTANWNLKKVTVLKELARAAYENPLHDSPWLADDNEETSAAAVNDAKAAESGPNGYRRTKCPVCGVESLVVFSDTDGDEDEHGHYVRWSCTYRVRCYCCSFELEERVGNGVDIGLPLEEYFKSW